MELKNLILEKKNGICTVKLNSPETLNSLDAQMLKELLYAFEEIENDKEIFTVILTGEGKAFVAGADIAYMSRLSPAEAKKFSAEGSRLFRKIETMTKVVIAAVNGFALGGGCELSMACDIRIASEKAKFGQPETCLGIIPGFSGTQRLSRLVGLGRAKELIFTGLHIDAEEALRIGLVNKVAHKDTLMDEAFKMAEKIASNSRIALSYAKEAMNRGIETDIETGIAYESNIFSLCFASKDQKEGMNAFLEKRKPEFE